MESVQLAEVGLTVLAFHHDGTVRTMLVDAEGAPVPFTPGWQLPAPGGQR